MVAIERLRRDVGIVANNEDDEDVDDDMIGKVVVVLSYFVVEDDGLAPAGLEITQASIHY